MIHRDVHIACDICSASEFVEGNVTNQEARKLGRKFGFRQVRYNGRQIDVCHKCHDQILSDGTDWIEDAYKV